MSKLKIGERYPLDIKNPFNRSYATILDLQEGYVKYTFIVGSNITWSMSEKEFIKIYRIDEDKEVTKTSTQEIATVKEKFNLRKWIMSFIQTGWNIEGDVINMSEKQSNYKFVLFYSSEEGITDIKSKNTYTYTYEQTGNTRELIAPLLFNSIEDAIKFKSEPDTSQISNTDYDFEINESKYWDIRVVEEEELKRYE